MKRKIIAILLATLMSATMFASIGIADMVVEIPEDAPKDVDVPTTFPEEVMVLIKDKPSGSKSSLPDLEVANLGRSREGDNYYEVWYRLYNTGEADLVDADFTDKAYLYNSGRWNAIAASEIDHTDFDLDEETYSAYFNWYFYPPTGWKTLSQWTDIDEEIEEMNENNNYQSMLWYWY
jgi:hypothetical protein